MATYWLTFAGLLITLTLGLAGVAHVATVISGWWTSRR